MFGDNIWKATERGDLEKVREFVARDGIPDIEDDYDSQSLLTFACKVGQVEIVRYLLENGFYELKYHRFAPFAFAAMEQHHIEVLRVLCEFGLDVQASEFSKHGKALFWTAVSDKELEIVRLFIEYGDDLEYSWWGPQANDFGYQTYPEDYEKETEPLVIEKAARMGRVDMVEFFLAVGANLDGQSAESYLQRARENELLRLEFEASRNPKPKPKSNSNSNSKPKVNTDEKLDLQSVLGLILVWAVIFAVLNWVSNIFNAWRK